MFKQILAAIDLDNIENAEKILQVAVDTANTYAAGLLVVSVISAAQPIVSQQLPEGYEKMAMKRTRQDLARLLKNFKLVESDVGISARFGDIYREILTQAEKSAADLIVIGSHKLQATDFLLGTNAARVVRHASCSVFVVR